MNRTITYRFKLKPTKAQRKTQRETQREIQREIQGQWLGTCRYVYHLCLDHKEQLYTDHGISINKNDMQKELSAIAKGTDWIRQVHSQTLQAVTDSLCMAYKNGKGFPGLARKGCYRSFAFKQGVKVHKNTCTVLTKSRRK